MNALIAAAQTPDAPFEIALVLSNRPNATGLSHAQSAGVKSLCIDHRDYESREAHERAVDAELVAHRIELVALAGYMRILTPWLVRRWEGRMLNIHPSLLPLYPGLDTHARALQAGDAEAGCTVHWVTEGMDEGPILGQARVPVMPDDTSEMLAARVLAAEHRLYPAMLSQACRALVAA